MTGIRQRILLRYLPVAIALAGMGYVLAVASVHLQRVYGGIPDPSNQVLWRTPLTMVCYGLILMLSMEGLIYLLRRKPPAPRPPELDDTMNLSRPGPTS